MRVGGELRGVGAAVAIRIATGAIRTGAGAGIQPEPAFPRIVEAVVVAVGRVTGCDAEDGAGERDDVELAIRIGLDGGDVAEHARAAEFGGVFAEVARGGLAGRGIDGEGEREDAAADEVGEEVTSDVGGIEGEAAVDGAAGDRVAEAGRLVADVVVDGVGGGLVGERQAGDAVDGAFAVAPSVVAPAGAGGFVVDLLAGALSDVADDHGAGAAEAGVVEGPLPRVAEAEGPDLGPGVDRRVVDEGVVGGHAQAVGVRRWHVDIDAEHLAEQRGGILRAVLGIVAAAAVAHPDVEVAIGAEVQRAAVVVRVGLRDGAGAVAPAQVEARGAVGGEGVGERAAVARDDGVAVGVGEVEVAVAVRGVVGGAGHAEQAAFAPRGDLRAGEREVVGGLQGAGAGGVAPDDADASTLLDDVLDVGCRRVLDEGDGRREPRDVGGGGERREGLGRRDDRQSDQGEGEDEASHGTTPFK